MKQFISNCAGALSILGIFALCFFLIYMGADVLSENYCNVPRWLGCALISEGFFSFVVIVYNVINTVCYDD